MKRNAIIIFGIIVTVFPLLLFLRTLCPVVFPGDSAEFAAVIELPTLAHPPGYPLYTVLGYLFTRLPLGPGAFEANLLSAVFGALATLLMYLVFIILTKRPVASAAAAMLLSFGNSFWKLSSIAEMYTLAALMTAAVWWAATRIGENEKPPTWKGFFMLGLLFGLGLANHQSIILILPGIAVYLILRKLQFKASTAASGVIIGLIIGLAFYLLLFPISRITSPMDAPKLNGFNDFWRYVTRQVYFTRSPEVVGEQYAGGSLVGSWDIAKQLGRDIWAEWGPIFFVVSIGGLIYLVVKRRALGWGVIVSIICFILGLCFLTRGSPLGMPKVDLRAVDWLVVPFLPLFAFGFIGALDGAYNKLISTNQLVGEESFIPKARVPVILDLFYIAIPIVLMLFNLDTANMQGHIFADRMVDNSMVGVQIPATIFTSGDEYYTFRYKIKVDGNSRDRGGKAPDVELIDAKNLRVVVEGSGRELDPDEGLAGKIVQEISNARKVYLTFLPSPKVAEMLRNGNIHLEHVALTYEAVPDMALDAAGGKDFIRFSKPGQEAEIWKSIDQDHLAALDTITLDPLEVPYVQRYFTEASNYGKLFFSRAEKTYSKSYYTLAANFLDKVYFLAGHSDESIDGIVRELALSNWYIHNYQFALDMLDYAAEKNIQFPERDPIRANLYFVKEPKKGLELGAEAYAAGKTKWMDYNLIEALMMEDVKAEKLDAAKDKAVYLISRYFDLSIDWNDPAKFDSIKGTLAEAPESGMALWHYASIASLQGDKQTVMEIVKLFSQIQPDFLIDRLDSLLTPGNFEKAIPFYEALVELNPEDWKAKEGLAICLFETGKVEGAKELASETIAHRPDSKNLKRILGIETPEEPPKGNQNQPEGGQ